MSEEETVENAIDKAADLTKEEREFLHEIDMEMRALRDKYTFARISSPLVVAQYAFWGSLLREFPEGVGYFARKLEREMKCESMKPTDAEKARAN